MNPAALTPELLTILDQADQGNVWTESAREPVRWMVGGRADARPCTPAVQCLIDAGLPGWNEYQAGRDAWRFAVPTDAGRELLATPTHEPEGH